jgi:hypothetical protein
MSDHSSRAVDFAAAIERLTDEPLAAGNKAAAGTPSEEDLERALKTVLSMRRSAPSPVESLLREVEEVAAVSGRFDPRDLFDESVDEEMRQTVLSRLTSRCVVEPFEGKMRWLLTKDARTAIINRLIDDGGYQRIHELLGEQPLPETDELGMLLRELLSEGADVRLEGRPHRELLALSCAIEATSEVPVARPDVETLNALIKREKFLSDSDVLLNKGFFGRGKEVQELKHFVTGGATTPQGRPWAGIVLTGLGGAGKSTLVAKVAREVADAYEATVVILDFDRPGIDARDLYWLESEMTRQVGRQYPETEQTLRELRQEARQQLSKSAADAAQVYAADAVEEERSLRRTVSGVAEALGTAGAGERPFMLVLDTFEEVTQRDLTGRIVEWIFEIAHRLAPAPLRVVFSGRLYYEGLQKVTNEGITQTLELGELEVREAVELLMSHGLSEAAATRLASSDVLPRRPLEMRLLARLVRGGDESAVEELEAEIRDGGEAARGLFAGLIYRRVLRRIENETARELAYPGLVLRYVTVDLIRKVLAPVLGLPALEDEEAQSALDALASYGWLAYRRRKEKETDKDEVHHRKDLRRSMLKAMIAQEGERARQINEAAAAFFAYAEDEREWAEGMYHRLMLVTAPEDGMVFEEAELKKAYPFIEGDAVDLPTAAAALLKYVGKGEVAVSEVMLLPPGLRAAAYLDKGQHLIGSREFGAASELYSRRPQTIKIQTPDGESFIHHKEWEVDLLFATAAWDALKRPGTFWAVNDDDSPVLHLANLLFPAEIAEPRVPPSVVQEFLVKTRDTPSPFMEVEPERRDLTIQRLAICLILLHNRSPLTHLELETASQLAEDYRRAKKNMTPIVERRLLFLKLLGALANPANNAPSKLFMSPAMFKLDLLWLANLPALLVSSGDVTLNDAAEEVGSVMLRSVDRQSGAVRRLLGGIDARVRSGRYEPGVPVEIDYRSTQARELVGLFRGPDPEFRDPCRYALLEAFPDQHSWAQLGSLISSVVRLRLEDLHPWTFAEELAPNPEHALESYVELVDRCWSLGKLLSRALKTRPDAPKLVRVADAYQRWDRAIRATLLESFRRLLKEGRRR